jgi:ABC-type dipeptide/oligopeptide/nickel transport system ATPase component
MTNPNPLYWESNMNTNMLWTLLGWKKNMNEMKGSKIAIICKSKIWIKSLNPTKKIHHQNLESHQN